MHCFLSVLCLALSATLLSSLPLNGQLAGTLSRDDLLVADAAGAHVTVLVAPEAGKWEKRAASDLVKYIGLMTGAEPALADTVAAVANALKGNVPLLIVGEEALKADASLKAALAKAAKPNPTLRADAFVVRRKGNRVLLVVSPC